jgi:uncharacterized membrane protein YeaQ/YmgE (transglycosylase-associated protein family)
VAGQAGCRIGNQDRIANFAEENVMEIVWFCLIGLCAGWLAGQLVKGGGFGLVGDLIVGVLGAILGGYLFRLLGIAAGGLIGALVTATIGAILLLVVVRAIKKKA